MDITVDLLEKICRACLCESSNMKSLYTKQDEERKLYDILVFTTNLDFRDDDELPKRVCNDCEVIMCKAYSFKRRCLESDKILKNFNGGNSNSNFTTTEKPFIVKNEKVDSNLRSLLNQPPKHSVSTLPDFDIKEALFREFNVSNTLGDNLLNTDSSLSHNIEISVKSVKEERTEQKDFSNNCSDDGGHFVETLPIEYNPRSESKQYKCSCGHKFNNKEKLKVHLKVFKCNKYMKLLKLEGKKIIPIKNQIACQKCDRQFSTVSSWKVHQRTHQRDNEGEAFHCSICFTKFKHKKSLLSHLRKHDQTDRVKFICDKCKREFKYKAYLENHILSAHPQEGFTCDHCMQTFTDRETLESHRDEHKINKRHKCEICKKAFHMACTLQDHMRTHTGEKPFLCSQCGKGFSQKANLAQHTRRHQGFKPFKCDSCEKGFVSKGELEAHARKHSGAHPFVCDHCGNGFTTSSALVKHRRIHTGERPYACDLCPLRFAASGTLKNHRRTHTGERPYHCSYCDKAFVQRNDLITHIRCHTGERPYICPQCGTSFRKASGLKTHVRMHGKEHAHNGPPAHSHTHNLLMGMPCDNQ